MARRPEAANAAGRRGSFRIIGGRWRSRRFDFVDDGSVRPTPDRIRETLFNWLANDIHGSRCLDLFAGSGALGLEALSRGAAEVVFVDRQAAVAERLRRHTQALEVPTRVVRGDALAYLGGSGEAFDIVFIDPPYAQGLVPPVLTALAPRLAAYNRVYVESEAPQEPEAPAGWRLLKSKRSGQVGYHLLSYTPDTA